MKNTGAQTWRQPRRIHRAKGGKLRASGATRARIEDTGDKQQSGWSPFVQGPTACDEYYEKRAVSSWEHQLETWKGNENHSYLLQNYDNHVNKIIVRWSLSVSACCFFLFCLFFDIRTLCCRIDFFSPVRTKIYGGGLKRLLNEGPVCPEGRPLKALIFWGPEWVNTSLGILPLLTHESELYLWIDGYCLGLNWLWQLTWSEVNTCIQ